MRAKQIDKNQPQIVKDLRDSGFTVMLDKDDILVGKYGKTRWIEIKDGSSFQKNGKIEAGFIKDSQYKILCEWKGQYNICWDLRQIRNLFQCSILDNMPDEKWDFGITPIMFKYQYKEWLTTKELNRLKQKPWWCL